MKAHARGNFPRGRVRGGRRYGQPAAGTSGGAEVSFASEGTRALGLEDAGDPATGRVSCDDVERVGVARGDFRPGAVSHAAECAAGAVGVGAGDSRIAGRGFSATNPRNSAARDGIVAAAPGLPFAGGRPV